MNDWPRSHDFKRKNRKAFLLRVLIDCRHISESLKQRTWKEGTTEKIQCRWNCGRSVLHKNYRNNAKVRYSVVLSASFFPVLFVWINIIKESVSVNESLIVKSFSPVCLIFISHSLQLCNRLCASFLFCIACFLSTHQPSAESNLSCSPLPFLSQGYSPTISNHFIMTCPSRHDWRCGAWLTGLTFIHVKKTMLHLMQLITQMTHICWGNEPHLDSLSILWTLPVSPGCCICTCTASFVRRYKLVMLVFTTKGGGCQRWLTRTDVKTAIVLALTRLPPFLFIKSLFSVIIFTKRKGGDWEKCGWLNNAAHPKARKQIQIYSPFLAVYRHSECLCTAAASAEPRRAIGAICTD